MKKLILAGAVAAFFTASNAWAVCSANIQMNDAAPADSTGNTITHVPLPSNATDVATKAYVDAYGALTEFSSEQPVGTLHDAANGCADLSENGNTDWYLPALDQIANGLADLSGSSSEYWTSTHHDIGGAGGNIEMSTFIPSSRDVQSELTNGSLAYVCIR
jgi:hypothetical protein